MLILSRKVGQSLVIGDGIEITVTEVSGDRVRIGIAAPKEVQVLRKELCQTVETNREAVHTVPGSALRMLAGRLAQK